MRVSYHAGERFLQRVLKLKNYTKMQILDAMKWIEKDISNIDYRYANFALPSFPSHRCIVVNHTLVTIVPKR